MKGSAPYCRDCVVGRCFTFHCPGSPRRDTYQCRSTLAAFRALTDDRAPRLIRDRRGVVLSDDVGIGKTWEALATAALLWRHRTAANPKRIFRILLIVPSDQMLDKWKQEVTNFFDDHTADPNEAESKSTHHRHCRNSALLKFGAALKRALDRNRSHDMRTPGIQVRAMTRYEFWAGGARPEVAHKRPRVLRSRAGKHLDLVIVDEAHHLRAGRAMASNLAELICRCEQEDPRRLRVLFLTATPFQVDHIRELTRLLSFLDRAQRPNQVPELKADPGDERRVLMHSDLFDADKSIWLADWLSESERRSRRAKCGAASAVEAMYLGLRTLSRGFDRVLDADPEAAAAQLMSRMTEEFNSMDRDVDNDPKTHGRTLYRRHCLAKTAEHDWHFELAPAARRACRAHARADMPVGMAGNLPRYVPDDPQEEGLDNYLRDFIIRNRREMPEVSKNMPESHWEARQVKEYSRHRKKIGEAPADAYQEQQQKDPDAYWRGWRHMRYLRLTSSFPSENNGKAVPHPKPEWLVSILQQRGVLLSSEAIALARDNLNRFLQGDTTAQVPSRHKVVVFFERLPSLYYVRRRLQREVAREYLAITGLSATDRTKSRARAMLRRRIRSCSCDAAAAWLELLQTDDAIEVLTGNVPRKRKRSEPNRKTRGQITWEFNNQSAPWALLCSKVAGEGIDLQEKCSLVIHCDLHWNPTVIDQRTGRVCRGNKDPTKVANIRLCLPHSYDRRVQQAEMARRKYKDFILGEVRLGRLVNRLLDRS